MTSCPHCGRTAFVDDCRVSLDGGSSWVDRRYIRCQNRSAASLCPVTVEAAGQQTQSFPRKEKRPHSQRGDPSE